MLLPRVSKALIKNKNLLPKPLFMVIQSKVNWLVYLFSIKAIFYIGHQNNLTLPR
jgi:hypothetical protein